MGLITWARRNVPGYFSRSFSTGSCFFSFEVSSPRRWYTGVSQAARFLRSKLTGLIDFVHLSESPP